MPFLRQSFCLYDPYYAGFPGAGQATCCCILRIIRNLETGVELTIGAFEFPARVVKRFIDAVSDDDRDDNQSSVVKADLIRISDSLYTKE